MTNKEKYKEEIKKYEGLDFCKNFIRPIILKSEKCPMVDCSQCRMLQMLWLEEEYVEPEPQVDWSKVPVDTKILVRYHDYPNKPWEKRYFCKYENGTVYAWNCGTTSWTNKGKIIGWKYAKLAESEE